jgi:hypothetical protein
MLEIRMFETNKTVILPAPFFGEPPCGVKDLIMKCSNVRNIELRPLEHSVIRSFEH